MSKDFMITTYERHVIAGLCKQYARKLHRVVTHPESKPSVVRATVIEVDRWEKIARGISDSGTIHIK